MSKAPYSRLDDEVLLLITLTADPSEKVGSPWRPKAVVATAHQIARLVLTPVHEAWLGRREGGRWLLDPIAKIYSYMAVGTCVVNVVTTAQGYQTIFVLNEGKEIDVICDQVVDYLVPTTT